MNITIGIRFNEKLALRDPERSELGKRIVREGLLLMYQTGYEHFTFKKLAETIGTTEASIYRYFENKHRMLLYFLTWYWNILEYSAMFSIQNLHDPADRIRKLLEMLTRELPEWVDTAGFDKTALTAIANAEHSKSYLVKEVDAINQERLFKPYKDLCNAIAQLFLAYNPDYPYPHSLASTVIETAQLQSFFAVHLPSLTDFGTQFRPEAIAAYLEHTVFAALDSTTKSDNKGA